MRRSDTIVIVAARRFEMRALETYPIRARGVCQSSPWSLSTSSITSRECP